MLILRLVGSSRDSVITELAPVIYELQHIHCVPSAGLALTRMCLRSVHMHILAIAMSQSHPNEFHFVFFRSDYPVGVIIEHKFCSGYAVSYAYSP